MGGFGLWDWTDRVLPSGQGMVKGTWSVVSGWSLVGGLGFGVSSCGIART